MVGGQGNLYIVYMSDYGIELGDGPEVTILTDGLYLVQTDQTRSQLYHSIKRRAAPRQLLVAPLAGLPKFKGMKPGSLNKMRAAAG